MARNPFLEWLAPERFTRGEGRAELWLSVREEFLQAQGRVHGGVLASLLDTVMGSAAGSLGARVVTVDLAVSYLRPAEGPRLVAEGWVVRAGESLFFAEGAVRDEGGQEVARAKGIFFRVG
ncbi:PaaI family thioesterase [Thermus filiformis]|uniref:Thioesterase n=1 Tax=Thermus filiformis TaxID=276 RepID=A0A0D6X9S2_THEFI|nr:PaaI family thioesterase [Thermus filiformis]KIX84442.1 thioesterase [Thermus filiformis]